ncbi:MAG: hypothetical protein VB051_03660 [Candidatus Pelethousia sp.]|nr:hypothetical protein [Candidatus Pelethousia sp.]
MAKAANTHGAFQAQHCAAGMFSFHKNGILQRHALPACLLFSLLGLGLITIELLGVLSLVAVLLISLLLMGTDGRLRSRIEG